MSYLNSGLLTVMLLVSMSVANETTCSVGADVYFKKSGTLHVYLVDKNAFKRKGFGIMEFTHKISPQDRAKGKLHFQFEGVTKGEYGIRCYIDTNNNGKLDVGTWGPKEPWGMSWANKKPMGKPQFKHIRFKVSSDITKKITVK